MDWLLLDGGVDLQRPYAAKPNIAAIVLIE